MSSLVASHQPRLAWWLLGVIFAAALVCNLRVAGTSPILWNDTVYEEREVQACLRDNSCTALGTSASLKGISFASGWLALREAAGAAGLGLDGTHVAVQVLRALAIVAAAVTAFRISGLTAAAFSMVLACSGGAAMAATPIMPVFVDGTIQTAIYNVVALPFLGSLLLLLCVLAMEEQGVVALVLAALVAAVMANVHVACASAGVSILAVALARREQRWKRFAVTAVVFAAAAFLIAPAAWLHDLTELRRQMDGSAEPRITDLSSQRIAEPLLLLVALSASWGATSLLRGPRAERLKPGLFAALLIGAPPLLAVIVAGKLGLARVEPRYYGYLAPVFAVVAATVLAALLGGIVQSLLVRDDSDRAQFRVVDRLAVVGAAFFLCVVPGPGELDQLPRLRVAAVHSATRAARDELHWSWLQTFRGIKTPYTQDALQLIETVAGTWPAGAPEGGLNTAILLPVLTGRLPQSVLSSVTVLPSDAAWSGLWAPTHTGLNWERFEACAVEKTGFTHCEFTGLTPPASDDVAEARRVLHGMPATTDLPHLQKFVLKIPWRPTAGRTELLFMPRMGDVCGGFVTTIPEGGRLSPDHRQAVLSSEGTVTFEWEPGSADCPAESYSEFPPFFLAGDREVVEFLAPLTVRGGRT